MSPQILGATRRKSRTASAVPLAAPPLASVLCGILSYRIFAGLSGSDTATVIARALPARVAALVLAGAARPLGPALAIAAVPLIKWFVLAEWGAGVPGVGRAAARRAVGWAWWGSVVVAAVALLAGVSAPKPGLAALGYAVTWPALISLGIALNLRRAGAQIFALCISAAAVLCLLLRVLPLGWPGQNSWTWWAMLPAHPWADLLSGAAWILGGWLLLIALSRLESRWPRRWAVAGLAVVALCFARGFPAFEHYGREKAPAALASEINTSYFQMLDATRNPGDFLRRFPELSDRFPMHGATHPAGWPLVFRAAEDAGATGAGSSVALGVATMLGADRGEAARLASDVARRPLAPAESDGLWLLVGLMLAALVALPPAVYFAARAHEAPRIAFRAAGLSAVLAAPLLFFPDVDLLYAPLAVLAGGAWMRSEKRGAGMWALLAGSLLAALSALSFGNLALYVLLILQSALSWRRRQATVWAEARRTGLLLLPAALVWTGAAAVGHDAWAVLGAALRHHHQILAGRSGVLWAGLNPLEFTVLMGLPISAWLVRATPWWHHPGAARKLRMDPESALFGATLLTLAALDLSGGTKGEAGRLWMMCMPLLVAGGAALWRDRRRSEWAWLCGASLALTVVLKGFYVFVWLYS